MRRTLGVALAVLGGAFLAVGLVIGFLPTTSGGHPCGSAFLPAGTPGIDTPYACADRRSLLRVPAVGGVVLGLVLLGGGWHVGAEGPTPRPTPGRSGQLGRSSRR